MEQRENRSRPIWETEGSGRASSSCFISTGVWGFTLFIPSLQREEPEEPRTQPKAREGVAGQLWSPPHPDPAAYSPRRVTSRGFRGCLATSAPLGLPVVGAAGCSPQEAGSDGPASQDTWTQRSGSRRGRGRRARWACGRRCACAAGRGAGPAGRE